MNGAIFDMDGLLFDTERLFWTGWKETAKQFGQTLDPAFLPAIAGSGESAAMEIIHKFFPSVDPAAFRNSCTTWISQTIEQHGVPEKPGMREILTFFQERSTKIAVASSSSYDMIYHNLRCADIEHFFDVVLSGEEVAHGKPAPDVFLLAAQRLGCAPADCYVFEDSINGVRAGMTAGCVTVMIPDLISPPDNLAVNFVCSSLSGAKKLLEKGLL